MAANSAPIADARSRSRIPATVTAAPRYGGRVQATTEDQMALRLGDVAPDFEAETTEGTLKFHEWLGDGWGVLFSHPKDFTPVCTTELGYTAKLKPEFEKRNVKVIGLSVDPLGSHEGWSQDIEDVTGHRPNFPMIADA